MKTKTAKTVVLVALMSLGLGCGPGVSGDADGGDGDAGAVDDDAEGFDAEWAIGTFHNPDHIGSGTYMNVYVLRSDGTGVRLQEGCMEGPMGPYDDFAWESISDTQIEVFSPDGGQFRWIRGNRERVTLTKVADGEVAAADVQPGATTTYRRGELCVVQRVPASECMDRGFDIDLCDAAEEE